MKKDGSPVSRKSGVAPLRSIPSRRARRNLWLRPGRRRTHDDGRADGGEIGPIPGHVDPCAGEAMLLTPRAATAKDALAMRAAVERACKNAVDFQKQRVRSRSSFGPANHGWMGQGSGFAGSWQPIHDVRGKQSPHSRDRGYSRRL